MISNNVPLTVQPFEHNALSPEFPGAVSSLNLLEATPLFREYFREYLQSIFFFSMISKRQSVWYIYLVQKLRQEFFSLFLLL